MSRRGLSFGNGFFPFPVIEQFYSPLEEGFLPVLEWDGDTIDAASGLASSSEDEYRPTTGPGTFYPIGLTHAEADIWLWRAKIWRWDISGGVLTPAAGEDVDFVPEAEIILEFHESPSIASRYQNLVVDAGCGASSAATGGANGPAPHAEIRYNADLWIGLPPSDTETTPGLGASLAPLINVNTLPRIVKRDGLFYPLVMAQYEFSASGDTGGVIGGLSFATFSGWASNFDMSISDKVLPMYQYGAEWSDEGNFGSATVEGVTIDKYFTYGGIYNETTGEPA